VLPTVEAAVDAAAAMVRAANLKRLLRVVVMKGDYAGANRKLGLRRKFWKLRKASEWAEPQTDSSPGPTDPAHA
jgi:hypothetical protein